MSSAPDLGFIITLMTDHLSTEQLADVLLQATPRRELRLSQPPTPPPIRGLRQQPRRPEPMYTELLDPAYSDLFVDDWEALDYLEYMRSVVLAQNPTEDADNLKFVLDDYEKYYDKGPPSVPDFFRPVLILFKKWHERAGNPAGDVDMRTHNAETSDAEPANPALGQNVAALLARLSREV
jgi:hypothetical protein